ncbi:MAG: hypothetical protein LBS77_05525 [Desulfovibrio sp.]|nr:hypothetical protein [Desulfovibrio sp.]
MTQTDCTVKSGAPSAGARLLRLGLALVVLVCIVYGFAPIPVEFFAPMREYADVVRDTGIEPGALYYTDVEQTNYAEMSNRDVIRYSTHSDVSPVVFVFVFLYFCILCYVITKRRRNI